MRDKIDPGSLDDDNNNNNKNVKTDFYCQQRNDIVEQCCGRRMLCVRVRVVYVQYMIHMRNNNNIVCALTSQRKRDRYPRCDRFPTRLYLIIKKKKHVCA